MYPCLINLKVLNFKDFMNKNNLKDNTMNESELQRVYNYNIYPRDSKKNQTKELLIQTMVVWEELIGHVL